jgi:hypothetical protein
VANQITWSDFAGPGAKRENPARGKCGPVKRNGNSLKLAAVTVGEVIEYPLWLNCQPKNSRNFHRCEKHAQRCGKFSKNFFSHRFPLDLRLRTSAPTTWTANESRIAMNRARAGLARGRNDGIMFRARHGQVICGS